MRFVPLRPQSADRVFMPDIFIVDINQKYPSQAGRRLGFSSANSLFPRYFAGLKPGLRWVVRRQGVSPRGGARVPCRPTNPRFPKNRNRVRGLRHTPYLNGRGRLKAQLRRSQNPCSVIPAQVGILVEIKQFLKNKILLEFRQDSRAGALLSGISPP